MKYFKDKRKRKESLYSLWIIGVLFILLLLLLKGVVNIYIKSRESLQFAKEAEHRVAELNERYRNLQRESQRLKTDEGIEEELRTKFGVVRPGERVIVIVSEEITATTTEEEPVYKRIFNNFKKLF